MTSSSMPDPVASEAVLRPGRRLAGILQSYGIVFAFIAIVVVFAVLSPRFATPGNLLNILSQMSVLGILASGMTLLLITGNFDLSIGSIMGVGGVVTLGLAGQIGLYPALLCALLAGAAIGLANGVIVVKAGINSLIVTLGMLSLARGAVLIYTQGRSIQGTSPELASFANGAWGLPNMTWVLIGIAGVITYVLTQTRSGRYLQASGGNAEAAELAGVRVDKYKIAAFVGMGLLAALAGALYAGRVNSVDPNAGSGFELQAIAAVIIGGTSLAGGSGAVWKSLVGAALLTVLTNGFNLLNIPSYYQYVIQGAVIILSVAIYTRRTRR